MEVGIRWRTFILLGNNKYIGDGSKDVLAYETSTDGYRSVGEAAF